MIEVLQNGEPFWEELPGAKPHFRFGTTKAIQLLSCIETIKKFIDSSGKLPGISNPVEISSSKWKVECDLHYHDGFKKRGGWIDRPYLKIIGEKTIAFGLLKAEALVALQKEITDFVVNEY